MTRSSRNSRRGARRLSKSWLWGDWGGAEVHRSIRTANRGMLARQLGDNDTEGDASTWINGKEHSGRTSKIYWLRHNPQPAD